MEFVACPGKSPEPHTLEAMMGFQMREAHLGTLSFVSRFGECLCLHLLARGYRGRPHGDRAGSCALRPWCSTSLGSGTRLKVFSARAYSALIPASLITWAHLMDSARIHRRKL